MASGLHRVDGGVGQARFHETLGPQSATVAQAAMPAVRRRIVAGPAKSRVQPQPIGFATAVRLAHMLARRVDADRRSEERRGGKECVRSFTYRCSTLHKKKPN